MHEVDSQYCQHCLEYIPTIDPKFQMNKCATCYQCPHCQHLLSTSILSISSPGDSQTQKEGELLTRTCQLLCEFCRWSSNTFITEGSRIVGNISETVVANSGRISELMSYYKAISQKEKTDKRKRRIHTRSGNTMDLLKKYGIDNTLSPKLFESLRARTSFHDKSSAATKFNLDQQKTNEDSIIDSFAPAQAVGLDKLDELNTELYYKKDFNIDDITGISERLDQIEIQPELAYESKPVSKSLSVKRSLRCKECERNLCRSEYSPISHHFKIQSSAFYHVPELKLRSGSFPGRLLNNRDNIIEFLVQNHTVSKIKLKFERLDEDADKELYDIVLPKYELCLAHKDATAEYEHAPFNVRPLNEETQITFQNLFKIGFYIKVKPRAISDNLTVRFKMIHDVALLQNPREGDKLERITNMVQHTNIIHVRLGPVINQE